MKTTKFLPSVLSGIISMCFVLSIPVNADQKATNEEIKTAAMTLSEQDLEALKLGKQILAIQEALNNPGDPNSIHKVTAIGWDQRYYLMVRGWLVLRLQADQSAYTGSQAQSHLGERIEFLKLAIRTIDLE
ncbi:hypothetical protein RI845_14205 [Thalassotalea nanhaiensis]|uniref:Uncharacterized protein n=1 Tax=Thalassotalea nanhaiensis TaxID=3065648 RepID=A0ABY9TFW5_9GAMM|nr:hypothetical protein RI845_14205 [Colwelliaceae bacterium SQ345]